MPIFAYTNLGRVLCHNGWGKERTSEDQAIRAMDNAETSLCLLAYASLELSRIKACLQDIEINSRRPKEDFASAMADGYLKVLKSRPGVPGEVPDGMVGIDGPIPMDEAMAELSVRARKFIRRNDLTRLSDITHERVMDAKNCGVGTAVELVAWRDQKMQRNAGLNPAPAQEEPR